MRSSTHSRSGSAADSIAEDSRTQTLRSLVCPIAPARIKMLRALALHIHGHKMTSHNLLNDAVNEWLVAFEDGNDLTAAELLPNNPELHVQLEDRLAVLRLLDSAVNTWQVEYEAGNDLTAAKLLPNNPELREQLEQRVADLRKMLPALRPVSDTNNSQNSVPDKGMSGQAPAFIPSGFVYEGELGRGGMGVVYLARDINRGGSIVALKTLPNASPGALYRFKQEFRTLAEILHPNLVQLYELIAEGNGWFFTMALVEGIDLRSYSSKASSHSTPDFDQVRSITGQLASGVHALHRAGVLHRDIKPSNAMIKPDGRVVLLDFGLATEIGPEGVYESVLGQVSGTVAYMAPEQAAGKPLSAAADWYAVGVVLYELLALRLPYTGTAPEIRTQKQLYDPPSPSVFRPGLPQDLVAICMELLTRDPSKRPTGGEVLRRLGVSDECAIGRGEPAAGRELIGREKQLEMLRGQFDESRQGVAVSRVSGPSGSGKSSLARAFTEWAAKRNAVTLTGRCYEQELVPFNSFDGVVDMLSQHMAGLTHPEVTALLPRDIGQLIRLFPVLARIPAVSAAPSGRPTSDPREARRRGMLALRELLSRLADRRPVVIVADDLQWGDADSAILLEELVRLPDPPAVMYLLCYRSGEVFGPTLQTVTKLHSIKPDLLVGDVPIGPLSDADALALAERLLGGGDSERASAVAREARGNPFYVRELAAAARDGRTFAGGPSLDRVLWDRVQALSRGARRLLEVVAVAGRPVPYSLVRAALGSADDLPAAEAMLRTERLTRGIGAQQVTTYHDRVREAVLMHLDIDVRRAHHLGLARAAENAGEGDPEFLAVHYHRAGEHRFAAVHYAAAGASAAAATAFDKAAQQFRLASELGDWPNAEAVRLRIGEANALANAGRGANAAEAYLKAAALDEEQAIEWRRRAAEQYLIAGHVETGLVVLRDVLADVGLTYPRTPFRAILGIFWARLRLRIRGLRFQWRSPEEIAPVERLRIDICWAAATGLVFTDTIRGMYFLTVGMLLALREGDLLQIGRALALESLNNVVPGGRRAESRSLLLLAEAKCLAAKTSDPYLPSFTSLIHGARHYLAGRFEQARPELQRAANELRERCTGVTWELGTARTWWLWSLCYLGRYNELAAAWPPVLRDAQLRGDLYAEAYLTTFIMATIRTAKDAPELAWDELREGMARWPTDAYHIQHHNELLARVILHLYTGDGPAALDSIRDKEPTYRRIALWRIQNARIDVVQLRARSALAAARTGTNVEQLLRSAERDAGILERESAAWGQALGALVRACVQASRGQTAPGTFKAAAEWLEAIDLATFAAAARYRQGERTDGEEGQQLRNSALDRLTNQGVRNPLKMILSHAPVATDDLC
jgi:eukaryotic-like serine/threonine-protein kinase